MRENYEKYEFICYLHCLFLVFFSFGVIFVSFFYLYSNISVFTVIGLDFKIYNYNIYIYHNLFDIVAYPLQFFIYVLFASFWIWIFFIPLEFVLFIKFLKFLNQKYYLC